MFKIIEAIFRLILNIATILKFKNKRWLNLKKERKDIRELEGAYEYVEYQVTDGLNRYYSYNGNVPENISYQVQKELEFIKNNRIAAVFFFCKSYYKICNRKRYHWIWLYFLE